MEKLMEDAIDYLESKEKKEYEMFWEIGVTELTIPETSKAIRNFVLKANTALLKSNNGMRLVTIPVAKFALKDRKEEAIVDNYLDYFKLEKECLKTIKKVTTLNSNDIGIPIRSYCGVLLHALVQIHNENQRQFIKLVSSYVGSYRSGFSVYYDEQDTIPKDVTLVKKINTTLNKFNNETKKNS